MMDVETQPAEVVDPGCDHSPVAIEFRMVYAKTGEGKDMPYKSIASRFACWKCAKLLPIDLKFLVLD